MISWNWPAHQKFSQLHFDAPHIDTLQTAVKFIVKQRIPPEWSEVHISTTLAVLKFLSSCLSAPRPAVDEASLITTHYIFQTHFYCPLPSNAFSHIFCSLKKLISTSRKLVKICRPNAPSRSLFAIVEFKWPLMLAYCKVALPWSFEKKKHLNGW